jgi:hypothetical protein
MDIKKISQIKPSYKYNSKVNSESVDILANYVASSVQWHKCYGTLRARGNTKKASTTKPQKSSQLHESSDIDYSDFVEHQGSRYLDFEPSERTLRRNVPGTNIQGKRHDTTTKEKSSAKRRG